LASHAEPTFSVADCDDYSLARGLRPLGMSFNIGNMAGFSPNLTLQEIPPDPTKNLDQIDDDPAFSWVPRWNNRLVLEAWSLGTFIRLNWWETWMADMKRREDKRLLDEKKEKDRARLEKEEQARKEAAKISREFGRDVAKTKEEEQRQLLAGEKLRVAISKITQKNETSRMRHFILLAKEHAKDEAKRAEFERTTRERRDENEAARQAEKARAAQVREQLLQKDFVKRTAVEEAVFQAKLAKDQEEKRQHLRMEVERLEREDARVRAEMARMFAERQQQIIANQQEQQRQTKMTLEEGAQWLRHVCEEEEAELARLEKKKQEASALAKALALARNNARIAKLAEMSSEGKVIASIEGHKHDRWEKLKAGVAAAEKKRSEQLAKELRDEEKRKALAAKAEADAEARRAKKAMREAATKEAVLQAELAVKHRKTAEKLRKQQEKHRIATEREQAQIRARQAAELDRILERGGVVAFGTTVKQHSPPKL
jgi:hypothetical protein